MKFYLSLVIFSIIVFAGICLAEPHLPPRPSYPGFAWIQLVMIATTIAFHTLLERALKKSGQAFVRYFMGATTVKLMLFMMIIVIYALLNREHAFGFILHFFILYLLYTIFEVYFAYKNFGPVKKIQS